MLAECVDDRRIELAAGVMSELRDRLGLCARCLVWTLVSHRLIGVAGGYDAGSEWDRRPGEGVRVSVSVPPLVGCTHEAGNGSHGRGGVEDALADDRVLTHELRLCVVQGPGLAQDLIGNRQLANVVQLRGAQ